MNQLFADTGYWVALIDLNDSCRDRALRLMNQIQTAHVITSDLVLVETLSFFSGRGAYLRKIAVKALRGLQEDPYITIIYHDAALLDEAFQLYATMGDKQWSPTDCASFVLMRKHNITQALAYDKHFEQAGFVALLRNP